MFFNNTLICDILINCDIYFLNMRILKVQTGPCKSRIRKILLVNKIKIIENISTNEIACRWSAIGGNETHLENKNSK